MAVYPGSPFCPFTGTNSAVNAVYGSPGWGRAGGDKEGEREGEKEGEKECRPHTVTQSHSHSHLWNDSDNVAPARDSNPGQELEYERGAWVKQDTTSK